MHCDTIASKDDRFAFRGPMSAQNLPIVDSEAIIERLASRLDEQDSLLAFDADGTLWSGDVSDDVFMNACREEWLLEHARPRLCQLARSLGLDTFGSASRLAIRLFEFQQTGAMSEVDLYAAMAWCYAGRTLGELTAYAAHVLVNEKIDSRLRPEITAVLDWARGQNVECYVVSASPAPIVEWAAAKLGFAPNQVIGTQPRIANGVIAPEISGDVPFGANKCKLLKRVSGGLYPLACFGDSEFDFELLNCAALAVAVSPKPSLLTKMLPLRHAVQLRTQNQLPHT